MLTGLDWAIVEWIGRVGAAGARDVQVALRISRTHAYRRLGKCVEAGVLSWVRLLHGEPGLYLPTRAGLDWTEHRDLKPSRVSAGTFAHEAVVARIAAAYEGSGRYRVFGERALRAQEQASGGLIASTRVYDHGLKRHHPDLVLRPRDREQVIAIEVELTAKAPQRLESICRAWEHADHVSQVRYYAAPEALRALERAIDSTGAAGRIQLQPLPW